jgi:rubrerythrin
MHELEAKRKPKVIQAVDPMVVAIRAKIEAEEGEPQPRQTKKRGNVNICPNCSKIIMGARKKCPSCGFVLF